VAPRTDPGSDPSDGTDRTELTSVEPRDKERPSMTANIDVVNGAYSAFASGDIAALVDTLSDDVEWSSPMTLPLRHGSIVRFREYVDLDEPLDA
jgi:ketosteroid isomerase-like protein